MARQAALSLRCLASQQLLLLLLLQLFFLIGDSLHARSRSELQDQSGEDHPPPNVHAFFYLWYGNPDTDGRYLHWDHEVLPHWAPATRAKHPHGHRHDVLAGEIHSPFFPARGLYSSNDPTVLDDQMQELRSAGIGTVVLSWWGQASREGTSDTQGVQTDDTIANVIAAVERAEGMFWGVHMEPYPGRTADTVAEDVQYLVARFGDSPAWRRIDGRRIFYVYDSYHIATEDWARVLSPADSSVSLRHENFFIALWLNQDGGDMAVRGGFDGVYTYFASDGFVYGSTTRNWGKMKQFCDDNRLVFVPSVGPGYNDEGIRPWNAHNTKSRENGGYYDRMWSRALESGAQFVSITSFNEWGEGTQIESARANAAAAPGEKKTYLEYPNGDPLFFISSTRRWVEELVASNTDTVADHEL